MKILIAYYSFSGNNELLAKELQTRLGCDLIKVNEFKKRDGFTILLDILFHRSPKVVPPKVLLSQYDRVILLAPIWAGRIASPMKSFLNMEKDNIKQYSFISLCGDGGNKKVAAELAQVTGKDPVNVLELKVSDLLKAINKRQFSSAYRVHIHDLKFFDESIDRFLQIESNQELLHNN